MIWKKANSSGSYLVILLYYIQGSNVWHCSDAVVVPSFSWLVSKLPWDYLHLLGVMNNAFYLLLQPLPLIKNVKQLSS